MSGNIKTVLVNELSDMTFFIPAYQRGYRWTNLEVTALLNDIQEFDTNNDTKKYCLQPLIVKKRSENCYEIVDGQQRLTTLFIIFQYIKTKEMPLLDLPFKIVYETRPGSQDFLCDLSSTSESKAKDNIDYAHIFDAWKSVGRWCEENAAKKIKRAAGKLLNKLEDSTNFIWYEIDDPDPIKLFTKENTGKIPLTSAELIKAVMLNSDNFSNLEEARKRQLHISIGWDSMERKLQNDSFWYFLNGNRNKATRIEMIFDILAKRYNKQLDRPVPEGETYFTFLVLDARIKNAKEENRAEKEVERIWNEADECFAEFEDWYENFAKYHIVGYLVAVGMEPLVISELLTEKTKSEAVKLLMEQIKASIEQRGANLSDLNYSSRIVRNVLLLFNIASLLSETQGQYRFPFDLYNTGKWDIEHIHAVKDRLPRDVEKTKIYLKSLLDVFRKVQPEAIVTQPAMTDNESAEADIVEKKKNAADEIAAFIAEEFLMEDADIFYEKLQSTYDDIVDLQEDDNIRNLALLDTETNRSYQNATFFAKREIIIKREKSGAFVPLCTKNVFLKLYSSGATDLYRWNMEDRISYVEVIKKCLDDFFTRGISWNS